MSVLTNLRRYGPRIVVGVFAMITIIADISLFFKQLEITKDLPADDMMARFVPMFISGVIFGGIQVQRIAACFASTTLLVQLTFYIWAVEFFLKFLLLFGSFALLAFNKDFAAKMKGKSLDMEKEAYYPQSLFWFLHCGLIVVGISLRMILNELRKRDKEAQRKKEAVLRLDQDMPPFPITTAKSSTGSVGEALRKEEAQKRLLQVRSWPRSVTRANLAMSMLDVVYSLAFDRSRFLMFEWYNYLAFTMIAVSSPMGLYALYHKSLRISRWLFWSMTAKYLLEVFFRMELMVEGYHSSNTSNTNNSSISTNTAIPLPTNESTTAKGLTYGQMVIAVALATLMELCILWSIWQVVKDLEARNKRIAKAQHESREAESSANTFTDEKDAAFHDEKGEKSSIVWI
ncbi:hypothetical protein BGZ96_009014 [Linnemannia gamsii]|uniref:Uncharacterized protein n=1 Tax=Linnemannia gamsii TaxID=64522 RepID=A0ABQ7JXM4_9FUNG|nr:hypothetical protein BGZ96_009014 [Linnemannia gamsii]